MISKYGIFCNVIEQGSFTKAALLLGYSQSAVSQTVKNLEKELGVTLIDRRRDGISLTVDGEQIFPYLLSIYAGEKALEHKRQELSGLENSIIRIGTFTSVSRNILPPLMKAFKEKYPTVTFNLRQGEYTSISKWIQEGSVDFGFVHRSAAQNMETHILYEDEMMAVLPPNHPLAACEELSLRQLKDEPFILLNEGECSVSLAAFENAGVTPKIAYDVYDDYTILAMVKQGLGVSLLYKRVLTGYEQDLAIRPVREPPKRVVALAWQNTDTLAYAPRCFARFIISSLAAE